MKDLGHDLVTIQSLCHVAAFELYMRDPRHELIRFSSRRDESVIMEEFLQRFAPPGQSREEQASNPSMVWTYVQYLLALRKVLTELSQT